MRDIRIAALALIILGGGFTLANAHVHVLPTKSTADATERYHLYVSNHTKSKTISVELEVPAGVEIRKIMVSPGLPYDLKWDGDRIVAITWKLEVKTIEFAEFTFLARNPKGKTAIVWKARQHLADGTILEWVAPPTEGEANVDELLKRGAPLPASVTRLIPGPVTSH